MSQASNYLESDIITTYFRTGTIKVGLHTGAPGEAGTSSEVSAGGYARQVITFGADTDGVSTNDSAPTFTATASWGTVTHYTIWNGTDCVAYGTLDNSRAIGDGDSYTFEVGALTVTVA